MNFPDFAHQSQRGRALRITEVGELVLHERAADVTEFGTPELLTLVDDMFASMDVAEGVGLAAVQVGVPLQVFVYDLVDDDDDRHVGAVINPVLTIDDAAKPEVTGEGCLSVPGAHMELARPGGATICGFDVFGKPIELTATGYLARCFIHETQHLLGMLYLDHLTPEQQAEALAQRDERRPDVLIRRAEAAIEQGKEPIAYPETPAGGR